VAHERFHGALRFMEIAPGLPGFELQPVDIEVREREGFCSALLPGGIRVEGSPSHLLSVLHELIFRDVERHQPDATIVHGATALIEGRRVLLIGRKGCGKTTLTLHLAINGHPVEGDEHLLVRPDNVVARPRTLRVKPGTLALIPGLAELTAGAPFLENWDGTPIWALNPAFAKQPWLIRAGRLDAIIFLTSNHGGRSMIDALPVDQAFRRLLGEVVRWPANVAGAASRLRTLLSDTMTAELLLGDLAGAEWHLKKWVTS
jgi:energy-coupling factor transporter ATP-binding protein EcfA2